MSENATLWIEIAKLLLEYVKVLIWPAVVLFIVCTYRSSIGDIVARLQSADLPGGVKLSLSEKIEEAQKLSTAVASAKVPEDRQGKDPIKTTEANERMTELGLRPSPSGLDMQFYRELADRDPNIALAGLRIDLEIMIKNLAKGWGISVDIYEPISKIVRKLSETDSISQDQTRLLDIVLGVCNQAAHGVSIERDQADKIINIAEILATQYIFWLSWGFED